MLPYKVMSARLRKLIGFGSMEIAVTREIPLNLGFRVNYIVRAWVSGVVLVLSLAACEVRNTGQPVVQEDSFPTQIPPSPTSTFIPHPTAVPSVTWTPSPSPAPTSPAPAFNLCSPLEGVELAGLADTISSPFHPPRPGSDEPHHGVDFAHFGSNRIALAGLPVLAALDGRVAGVIHDRFPYGNTLIVETSLEELPHELQSLLPEIDPVSGFTGPLTCPPPEEDPDWDPQNRSLYLLYAHLQDLPSLQPGDEVSCGVPLGRIGDSGNALNPHLHLEMRTGPRGAHIPSLSHYHPAATAAEMSAYCTWRISGYFQKFDPMILFSFWEDR
jgi:murein DD-endopeptidase MepM/ murein hydrolase activator NlpD